MPENIVNAAVIPTPSPGQFVTKEELANIFLYLAAMWEGNKADARLFRHLHDAINDDRPIRDGRK